jgi:hypothetical protein
MSNNALILLTLNLLFLSGAVLFNAGWRKVLLSRWWVIPALIIWCIVSSIFSTSDYSLLWWIGVGLLWLLDYAFSNFPSSR